MVRHAIAKGESRPPAPYSLALRLPQHLQIMSQQQPVVAALAALAFRLVDARPVDQRDDALEERRVSHHQNDKRRGV